MTLKTKATISGSVFEVVDGSLHENGQPVRLTNPKEINGVEFASTSVRHGVKAGDFAHIEAVLKDGKCVGFWSHSPWDPGDEVQAYRRHYASQIQ